MPENEEPHSRIRRSGLRVQPQRKERFTDEELEYMLQQEELADFQKSYETLLKERKRKQAYLVFFKDRPNLFYISFQLYEKRHVSRLVASKYFKKIFNDRPLNQYYWSAQRRRIPIFDKYRDTERVPIQELMKAGATFSCSTCGLGKYTYTDIENKKCFVIEGEGNINPFTSGMIVCSDCRRKFFN